MQHRLELTLGEDDYQVLASAAQIAGQTPEETAQTWLLAAIRTAQHTGHLVHFLDLVRIALSDPVVPFIGAIRSDMPDWSERHDYYIGQTLRERMSDAGEGDVQGDTR